MDGGGGLFVLERWRVEAGEAVILVVWKRMKYKVMLSCENVILVVWNIE